MTKDCKHATYNVLPDNVYISCKLVADVSNLHSWWHRQYKGF